MLDIGVSIFSSVVHRVCVMVVVVVCVFGGRKGDMLIIKFLAHFCLYFMYLVPQHVVSREERAFCAWVPP